MQNVQRTSLSVGARNSLQAATAVRKGSRSSILKSAGSLLSAEQPLTAGVPAVSSTANPFNASGSTVASARAEHAETSGDAAPGTPPEDANAGNCGLTPASLKHLRRQNAKLTEEKEQLRVELEKSQALVKELRERIAALEEQLSECAIREEKLLTDVKEACEREEQQRKRAEDAERINTHLEELLAAKGAEVARLRQALEDQLLLTKEVCEAAERSTGEARAAADAAEEIARLKEQVQQLTAERDAAVEDSERRKSEHAEMQQRTGMAMAAAEKAMTMHAMHLQRVEQLRLAKLAEAIQHKVELHISVPRVTLSYNNAPPLQVNAASALSDEKVKSFLEKEVFVHFDALWATLDDLDQAPDGTTKKAYSTRMLERLTEAVKGFVERAQRSESEGGLEPSLREPITPAGAIGTNEASRSATCAGAARSSSAGSGGAPTGPIGAAARHLSRAATVACGESRGAGAEAKPRGGSGGCSADSLAEVDRERLLTLLRSGDDRGLDSKLKDLLASRS